VSLSPSPFGGEDEVLPKSKPLCLRQSLYSFNPLKVVGARLISRKKVTRQKPQNER